MDAFKSWSGGFEFVDIEIIDHKNESETKKRTEKFECDQCSLFFLEEENLVLHQKKHETESGESVKCRYCNKILSATEESKESYANKKCETCEYRCSKCPQRFLRHSSLLNHEKNHILPRKKKSPPTNKKFLKNGLRTPGKSVTNKEKQIINVKKKLKNLSELSVINNASANCNNEVFLNASERNKKLPTRATKSLGEEMLGLKKNKPNSALNNTLPTITSALTQEKTINYKPFSCHVCGDNFASDSLLLQHIKSHGEVANDFKCKHCDNKFENIYEMQFHLATCPLAEDELKSMKAIPIHFKTPRKRGRPRKVHTYVAEDNFADEPPSSTVKRSSRKRKMEESEGKTRITPNAVRKLKNTPFDSCSNIQLIDSESVDCDDEITEDPDEDKEVDVEVVSPNIESNSSKKDHACPFPRCDMKFSREKALLCHMRNHNDDFDENLKCHECDIPFEDLQSLRKHINNCKGIREDKDDDFEDPESLEIDNHKKTYHRFQKSDCNYLCKICGRAYYTSAKLKSHKCQGANPLSMKFPCRICGEELINQRFLKKHFKALHPANLVYQCPKCHEEFDDLMEANNHLLLHVKLRYDCTVCFEMFGTKPSLIKHYTERHPGIDRSTCGICYKKYSDPSALAKHRHVHTGERPYQCPICYMTFNLKNSQVVHLRRHTNCRPYKCKICPKAFFNCGDLKKHIRIHTGERPYQCNICKMRFTLKESLNNHMKSHLNRRPHKCPYCPKGFNSKTYLKYHVATHWGGKAFQCPLCSESYNQLGNVRTHVKISHISKFSKSFICQICGKDQVHAQQLLQHLMIHRKEIKDEDCEALTKKKFTQLEPQEKKKKGYPKVHQELEEPVKVVKKGRQRKYFVEPIRHKNNPVTKNMCDAESDNSKIVMEDAKIEIKEERDEDNGVYEVATFQPTVKEEFACTLCSDVFDSFETLLNHVHIHI